MADENGAAVNRRLTTWESIKAYGERRALVMLLLGFSSGLPYLLVFDTLSAWLRTAGLSLSAITLFSLATLVYSFKFVWAPLLDRTQLPVLTKWLGHRRSWMLVCQAVVIVGLWMIAGVDPAANLGLMAAFAVMTAFAGATQDIVVDAWRIEATTAEKQGVMAAAYQLGWRGAFLTAGLVPLILAELYGWRLSYAVMAALMALGVAGVLLAPKAVQHVIRLIPTEGVPERPVADRVEWGLRLLVLAFGTLLMGSGLAANISLLSGMASGLGLTGAAESLTALWENGIWVQFPAVILGLGIIALAAWPAPGRRTRPGVYLSKGFGEPLAQFFGRFGSIAGPILALICLYRVSDFVLNVMNPFYLDLGFTLIEIGEVRKVLGVIMTSVGVVLGGFVVARFGVMRAMIIGAFLGPLSNLVFAWLATQGDTLPGLAFAIAVDNVAGGVAGTALIAYMSSLTSLGFTATQYALFSSLYALPGRLIASQTGRIIESSARDADAGGVFSPLTGLFSRMPAGAYVEGAATAGVSPAALGAGYVVFFLYSTVIGLAAMVLVFYVAARQPRAEAEAAARAADEGAPAGSG